METEWEIQLKEWKLLQKLGDCLLTLGITNASKCSTLSDGDVDKLRLLCNKLLDQNRFDKHFLPLVLAVRKGSAPTHESVSVTEKVLPVAESAGLERVVVGQVLPDRYVTANDHNIDEESMSPCPAIIPDDLTDCAAQLEAVYAALAALDRAQADCNSRTSQVVLTRLDRSKEACQSRGTMLKQRIAAMAPEMLRALKLELRFVPGKPISASKLPRMRRSGVVKRAVDFNLPGAKQSDQPHGPHSHKSDEGDGGLS